MRKVQQSKKLQPCVSILAGSCKQRAKYTVTPGICGVYWSKIPQQREIKGVGHLNHQTDRTAVHVQTPGRSNETSVLAAGCEHRAKCPRDVEVSGKTRPGRPDLFAVETMRATTDLPVQAGGHGDDVPGLAVDGEHVGDGAVGRLRQDAVAHHAVGRGGVVRVAGRHLHDGRACGRRTEVSRGLQGEESKTCRRWRKSSQVSEVLQGSDQENVTGRKEFAAFLCFPDKDFCGGTQQGKQKCDESAATLSSTELLRPLTS